MPTYFVGNSKQILNEDDDVAYTMDLDNFEACSWSSVALTDGVSLVTVFGGVPTPGPTMVEVTKANISTIETKLGVSLGKYANRSLLGLARGIVDAKCPHLVGKVIPIGQDYTDKDGLKI